MARMNFIFHLVLILIGLASSDILEKPQRHNYAWKRGKRSDKNSLIDLTFALKQQNVEQLIDTLLQVSTPSNDNYGKHLTMTQIHDMIKPSDLTTSIIKNWLLSNDIKLLQIENLTLNGDFLIVKNTTIGFAEKLLSTKYYDYTNDLYPNCIVKRVNHESYYHIPDNIKPHLDFISPTHRFPSQMIINTTHKYNNYGASVTPSFLRQLYSVGETIGKSSKNIQGVASFLEEYYNQSDLETFWSTFNVPVTNITNVPANQTCGNGGEAQLDVQYITALGEEISTQVWYTPGRAPNNAANEPFLTWLLNVESTPNAPLLFSISYAEDEKSVGYEYASRINTELAKLGTNGTSFLFASGDSGAGGNCTASNGRETPFFPAGSPYVTAVGGTNSSNPEVAWKGSGGGFSDYWSTQSWQQNAVNSYFQIANGLLPAQNKWNQTGRGYPDIAAQSVGFQIINHGTIHGVSGTSCATPTAAGIFALLNDLRLQKNMSPLGFLNPFIYETVAKDETILNDIISGQNKGCNGTGFPAVKQWDAVTGYGTPNYVNLAKYVLQTGIKTRKYHT